MCAAPGRCPGLAWIRTLGAPRQSEKQAPENFLCNAERGARSGENIRGPIRQGRFTKSFSREIEIQLRRGTTAMTITWPVAAAADCAAWLRELLR